MRYQYKVVKSWDSRAARDNLVFLVKDFQRLKRQKKEQFDVDQEIIAIERIECETNALWGMWKSSSASGNLCCGSSGSHTSPHSITHPARYACHDHSPDRPTHFSTARSTPPTCCGKSLMSRSLDQSMLEGRSTRVACSPYTLIQLLLISWPLPSSVVSLLSFEFI